MIRHEIIKRITSVPRIFTCIRNSSSSSQVDIESLEKESPTDIDFIDDELKRREDQIQRIRNKSRLREQDRKILMDKNPYPEPMLWHHGTLKYLRRTYGRYGQVSGINPSICWPTKEELDDAKEYERIKYPFTIAQVVSDTKQKRIEKEERIMARQQDIIKKLEKLEGWKKDLYERIAKKENEAKAAKDRKERLIDEVKRHFGYTVDPKDERFKEMLEKKEKEQKKAMKEERKKAKEAKMISKLLKSNEANKTETVEKQDELDKKEQ
ncbi:hypothetical protein JTB14_022554 [Gonioctena quinquepunctata]|nr:hypothetical protein JTB14_022554 [Gonioctena quinquepunctata]